MTSREAYELSERMIAAGASVEDLKQAVTEDMMLRVGEKHALTLSHAKMEWEYSYKPARYSPPKTGHAWAIVVNGDLTTSVHELTLDILAHRVVTLATFPKDPVGLSKEPWHPPAIQTKDYNRSGRCGFLIFTER